MVRRLAGLLPADVRVLAAVEVPVSFDARFGALCRRYEYRVTDAPWGADPLAARYTLAWPRPLDLPSLSAAAAGLVGERDFAGPADPLVEALPDARLVVLPRTDHFSTPKDFLAMDAALTFLEDGPDGA